MFKKRLYEYRVSLGLTQKEMAGKLNVTDAYYSMIENGKRNPSKNFLHELVALSGEQEEYWLYGVKGQAYIDMRTDFKCTKTAIDQLLDLNLDLKELFKKNNEGDILIKKNSIEELLVAALEADIECLILKQTSEEQ